MAEFDYNQLIAPGIGAGAAFLGSIPQMTEARRLRKERERLMAEGSPGFTPIEQQQMAEARSRAASTLTPGYGQEMEGIAQQQADILAAGKRGSATSSNLMNLLSRMNAQGQAARRNLAMRGAQAQRAAQSELGSLSMSADARRIQREQLRERQLAAMDAAARQYRAQAGMAPLQGAIAFMPLEGLKFGTGTPKTPDTPSPYKSFAEIPAKFSETKPMYNPYEKMSGIRMATSTGPGATSVTSGLYPTPPQEQPSFLDATYKNMFDPNAAARRIQMTENAEAKRAGMIQTRMPKFNSGVQIPQRTPRAIATTPNPVQNAATISQNEQQLLRPTTPSVPTPVAKTPTSTLDNLDRRPTAGPSSSYRLTMPAVGKNNFYTQPYVMQQRDGSSVVFETDGSAVMVSKNGEERKGRYAIKNNQIEFYPED